MSQTLKLLENYKCAGWLGFIAAFLLIPITSLSFYLRFSHAFENHQDMSLTWGFVSLSVIYLTVFSLIMLTFKTLLNQRVQTSSFNVLIYMMIGLNIVLTLTDLTGFIVTEHMDTLSSVAIISMIPYGIINIIIGIKLLKLDHNLFEWKTSFAVLTIIGGASLMLIFIGPLALLTSFISFIILSNIFFNAAKKSTSEDALTSVT